MDSTENESSSHRKKRANPDFYQRSIIKKERVKGEPYKNYKGNNIPGKILGSACSCRAKCFEKFANEELHSNMVRFISLESKDQQDICLQGLIEVRSIQRRRARVEVGTKAKSNTFEYTFKGSDKIEVCLKAFISVYGITLGRVRRLKDLAVLGKSPRGLRGKNPSGNQLGEELQFAVREHIQSFPVKLSHYANREVKYLNSELNLKIRYDLGKIPHIESQLPILHKVFSRTFFFEIRTPSS
ncbi:unnamed protein product [Acanthoscelides obtectus]|uniref:Uncharacterized protein n=1 Tax=Acanthoscelides obtectus TaxID=200917 RepID=A0A9P0KDQ5_ACAOB|nr:unnamed protein product [Acanthoscelides obtectus]CAK1662490.1 hypothetical protein AOBTE_LOCUS23171 [Acanthoscelides obtectus]